MILIDSILLLPFKGFIGIVRKIQEMAEREFTDEDYIRERLMELQLKFELDELKEEEYKKQEEELMARLNAIKNAQ